MSRPRVLKSKWFQRFARKERIADASLLDSIRLAENGHIDADLGGGLIKQRVARSGGGKSGGFRTIICFRRATLAVFMYGFAKNDRDNLEADEVEEYKKAAKHILDLSQAQLDELVAKGDFSEVHWND